MTGVHELVARQARRTPDAVAARIRGAADVLSRARDSLAAARAPAARPGRPAGRRRWALRGALARHAGRPARHPRGRWGLRAARSGLSGRASGVHDGGRRLSGARHPGATARRLAAPSGAPVVLDADRASRRPTTSTCPCCRRRRPGVCHLHLRLHRPSEGRADPSPRARQPAHVDEPHTRSERARRAARRDDAVLRHRGPRALLALDRRRARRDSEPGGGAGQRPAQRAHDDPRRDGHAGDAGDLAPVARRRLARARTLQDPLWR